MAQIAEALKSDVISAMPTLRTGNLHMDLLNACSLFRQKGTMILDLKSAP